MVQVLLAPMTPVYEGPERREPMERGEHPGHGEVSDESPMFVGTTSNPNVATGRIITVDSGAAASPYIHDGWLHRGMNLVVSRNEFGVVERISPSSLRLPLAGGPRFTGPRLDVVAPPPQLGPSVLLSNL